MASDSNDICKSCAQILEDCVDEGLTCTICSKCVHVRCLKQKVIPGALHGDIFFTFTCHECSSTGKECFAREKMSWLKVLVLAFYHLQAKSPGLGRRGYFHWRNHVASLIDRNWDVIFPKDFKKKKKWVGTIAGTLSHFTNYFFKSGTAVVNEPAWWALTYPKLTPYVTSKIYSDFTTEKQKLKAQKIPILDSSVFEQILHKHVRNADFLTPYLNFNPLAITLVNEERPNQGTQDERMSDKQINISKRKALLPTLESTSKRLKLQPSLFDNLGDVISLPAGSGTRASNSGSHRPKQFSEKKQSTKFLDPLCHYNTCLSETAKIVYQMPIRLMACTRTETIRSPYSDTRLKPFIRRDKETISPWTRLMHELQLTVHHGDKNYTLPMRPSIDYAFVQPEHIPAINSLCNQFFWPGITMEASLHYPEYSCVAVYGKLIIGFAFLVPDVNYNECYMTFLFVRPGWRTVGIGSFMIYHLLQIHPEADITLHIPMHNPALLLYQKCGFKIENRVKNFYEKYNRIGRREFKEDAFLCRLRRTNFTSLPKTRTRTKNGSHVIKPAGIITRRSLHDPNCHFNTAMKNAYKILGFKSGNFTKSPYSGICLKPFIRIDHETFPPWLQLMTELLLTVNQNSSNHKLPPRRPIEFVYLQPEHIPAISSLCNQFFWTGIDMEPCLQCPDFSCVVMYGRLIVGFAFLVPSVSYTENYLSFIFVRPGWRCKGIAKFMIYHLIQSSRGKDITLHVSINNPALLLYQKFGFKVEAVVKGFYDKYLRHDSNESKDAFFCRLER